MNIKNIREIIGAVLLTGGSVAFGAKLAPIILGGLASLSPLEALVFVDGIVAVAVGAWMLVVPSRNP